MADNASRSGRPGPASDGPGEEVCRSISTNEEFDDVLTESFTRPVLLLKHSDSCGRSELALHTTWRELRQWAGEVSCRLVVVQESRALSTAIQTRLRVRHETPQLLLLRDGRVAWHASHWQITEAALRTALMNVANADAAPLSGPPDASAEPR